MSKEMRDLINKLKNLEVKINLNESLDEQRAVLYHRIGNKRGLPIPDLIKSVVENGLECHDNGEVGSTIWFSDNINDYGKNGLFVVSIEYNPVNKEKYNIYYTKGNAYAYKNIPFEALTVVKMPVADIRGHVIPTDEFIEHVSGKFGITPDSFDKIPNATIFADVFNAYVQPYIEIPDYINQITSPNVKLINIMR
jgi:hypothetical protein